MSSLVVCRPPRESLQGPAATLNFRATLNLPAVNRVRHRGVMQARPFGRLYPYSPLGAMPHDSVLR